jgi:AcrR family transcriptional regulator
LLERADECRFTIVNLDSSRRRTRQGKQTGAQLRDQMRDQMRKTMRETVRRSILEAAEELIAKNGMHAAALVQIARRAGVAVGTLYNYFTDRDALIRGLFELRRATLRPLILDVIRSGSEQPFEPRLRGFVRGVLATFESHRSFLKISLENEHARPAGATTPQDLLAGARDIVAAGVREGAIDPGKAELLPMMITGTIKTIAVHRLQTGGELVRDADTIVEVLLAGVRSSSP